MFKTELHCHSAEVSRCASATASQIVDLYSSLGYSTIVLTNHFSSKTFGSGKPEHPLTNASWEERIAHYINGYHVLLEAAEGKLNILFGAEVTFKSMKSHFLIYGLTEEFLYKNPLIMEEDPIKFSEVIRENGMMFVQAHPFRDKNTVTPPASLDGIEVYNGGPKDCREDISHAWADKFSLLKTSGSDFHHCKRPPSGGILTEHPIITNEDLLKTLKSGNYEVIGKLYP